VRLWSGHLVHGPKILPDRVPGVNRAGVSRAVGRATATIGAVKKAMFKRTLGVGVVAGVVFAAWRAYKAQVSAPGAEGSWEAAPFPFPPIPRPRPSSTPRPDASDGAEASVEPLEGACPASHPVKGKVASGIYHLPGGLNYERTRPDRCYADADAAESDGLRPAKR